MGLPSTSAHIDWYAFLDQLIADNVAPAAGIASKRITNDDDVIEIFDDSEQEPETRSDSEDDTVSQLKLM